MLENLENDLELFSDLDLDSLLSEIPSSLTVSKATQVTSTIKKATQKINVCSIDVCSPDGKIVEYLDKEQYNLVTTAIEKLLGIDATGNSIKVYMKYSDKIKEFKTSFKGQTPLTTILNNNLDKSRLRDHKITGSTMSTLGRNTTTAYSPARYCYESLLGTSPKTYLGLPVKTGYFMDYGCSGYLIDGIVSNSSILEYYKIISHLKVEKLTANQLDKILRPYFPEYKGLEHLDDNNYRVLYTPYNGVMLNLESITRVVIGKNTYVSKIKGKFNTLVPNNLTIQDRQPALKAVINPYAKNLALHTMDGYSNPFKYQDYFFRFRLNGKQVILEFLKSDNCPKSYEWIVGGHFAEYQAVVSPALRPLKRLGDVSYIHEYVFNRIKLWEKKNKTYITKDVIQNKSFVPIDYSVENTNISDNNDNISIVVKHKYTHTVENINMYRVEAKKLENLKIAVFKGQLFQEKLFDQDYLDHLYSILHNWIYKLSPNDLVLGKKKINSTKSYGINGRSGHNQAVKLAHSLIKEHILTYSANGKPLTLEDKEKLVAKMAKNWLLTDMAVTRPPSGKYIYPHWSFASVFAKKQYSDPVYWAKFLSMAIYKLTGNYISVTVNINSVFVSYSWVDIDEYYQWLDAVSRLIKIPDLTLSELNNRIIKLSVKDDISQAKRSAFKKLVLTGDIPNITCKELLSKIW
jgi:nitrate reductase NapAB chaperone NapD